MSSFGQIVVGPPGSGKSTYCAGLQEFYQSIGRNCAIINLDPANENVPYTVDVNITELIDAQRVADELKLGPNSTLVYCMEYLQKNFAWLLKRCRELKGKYLLFDFPGQVELFTHYSVVRSIVQRLVKHGFRLTAVNLVDSHNCSDAGKFISAALLSLTVMLQLELPHVNVLSKVDVMEKDGNLSLPLYMFTDGCGFDELIDQVESNPRMQRFATLNRALGNVLQNYNLVNFQTLNIQDKESVLKLAVEIDKSNGYVFGNMDVQRAMAAFTLDQRTDMDWNVTIQERYASGFDGR